jgi:hypothetical protein
VSAIERYRQLVISFFNLFNLIMFLLSIFSGGASQVTFLIFHQPFCSFE